MQSSHSKGDESSGTYGSVIVVCVSLDFFNRRCHSSGCSILGYRSSGTSLSLTHLASESLGHFAAPFSGMSSGLNFRPLRALESAVSLACWCSVTSRTSPETSI